MKQRLVVGHRADVGREREHQEDAYACLLSSPNPNPRRKGAIFVVADGVGGYQAGEQASQMAARLIPHFYYADPDDNVAAALRQALLNANAAIHEAAQRPGQQKMATTVVCAVCRDSLPRVGILPSQRRNVGSGARTKGLTAGSSAPIPQPSKNIIRTDIG